MKDWVEFWNTDTNFYAPKRYTRLYFRTIARAVGVLVPLKDKMLLNFGCGEAGETQEFTDQGARVLLFDPAREMERRNRVRYAGMQDVSVLSAADIEQLPEKSLDVIVVNSVVQYMRKEEFAALAGFLRRRLKDDGVLIIGDVVPPNVGMVRDTASYLYATLKQGVLLSWLSGFVRIALSSYRDARRRLGFTTWEEHEMLTALREAGYSARRERTNLTLSQTRMTFTAVPRA